VRGWIGCDGAAESKPSTRGLRLAALWAAHRAAVLRSIVEEIRNCARATTAGRRRVGDSVGRTSAAGGSLDRGAAVGESGRSGNFVHGESL